MRHARSLVRRVCDIAGQVTWIDDLRHDAIATGLVAAVEDHDTAAIFDWLMHQLSFQGISDAVADGYIDRHGNVTWADIAASLATNPGCDKLQGYWGFTGCQYHKGAQTCAEPDEFGDCPLPRHPLRNGRLNQTAYGLFLFIRDIAGGDIVGWIDRQLTDHAESRNLPAARAALLDPLRNVYGISDKVIAMALASLLMGAGATRPGWFAVGASFVVVDTLVHNFLVRTGILDRVAATHPYGPACYRPGGCAGVLIEIAAGIDARRFNPGFPAVFPRFIASAIWRYCAQPGLDICNGNQIDDRGRCTNMWCRLYSRCDRRALHQPAENS
ncbi:MAG: hypothetical protein WBX05_06360 [Pseudolabrys sp.]